jgi:hypothetical protein
MNALRNDMNVLRTATLRKQAQELDALDRLVGIAKRDTDQSRRVADFLLAWWNSGSCGSFDLTNLWAVDEAIAIDMQTVFGFVARIHCYPDSLGYERDFRVIIEQWRPELCNEGRP